VILTEQTESQLVANSFANAPGAGAQELFYADSVDYCGRMRIAPGRVTTTGLETRYIDRVFNSEAKSFQSAATRGRHIESCYKGVALSDGD
jgi:hypothetical protein